MLSESFYWAGSKTKPYKNAPLSISICISIRFFFLQNNKFVFSYMFTNHTERAELNTVKVRCTFKSFSWHVRNESCISVLMSTFLTSCSRNVWRTNFLSVDKKKNSLRWWCVNSGKQPQKNHVADIYVHLPWSLSIQFNKHSSQIYFVSIPKDG